MKGTTIWKGRMKTTFAHCLMRMDGNVDKVLRLTRNLWIVGGSAVSSVLRQLLTSAEIEEVRGLSCGALDPEFDAEEDAAREMFSQSDL